jgi:hypothetical protein
LSEYQWVIDAYGRRVKLGDFKRRYFRLLNRPLKLRAVRKLNPDVYRALYAPSKKHFPELGVMMTDVALDPLHHTWARSRD